MNKPNPASPIQASSTAFKLVLFAYVVAVVVAVAVVNLVPGSALEKAFWADSAATLVIYGFSCYYHNASFYDAYWSVAPPFLALYFFIAGAAQLDLRNILVFVLVWAWAIRLTHNWARGWQGLEHEDWRYVDLQATTGRWWWLVNLLGIHLMPTLLVFIGCISLHVVFTHPSSGFSIWDLVASAIGWGALWLEYRADNELHNFKQNAEPGALLSSGVWRWCRHPNYTGEIGFWVALYAYACAASGGLGTGFAWLGPAVMLILFVFISIPMIDKRMARNRPSYAQHMSTSFALIPISHWVWPEASADDSKRA